MNLDWKEISQSEGYRSLKAAMIEDIQGNIRDGIKFNRPPFRNKYEFRKTFNWVISRAMHYAHHQSKTVGQVLTEWEAKRNGIWWFGYYQDCHQPKLNKSPHVKWKSLKSRLKEDLHSVRNAPNATTRTARIKKHYRTAAICQQKEQSKRQGKKARWSKNDRRRKYK